MSVYVVTTEHGSVRVRDGVYVDGECFPSLSVEQEMADGSANSASLLLSPNEARQIAQALLEAIE